MGVYDYKRTIKVYSPEDATMDASEAALQGNDVKTYVEVIADFSTEGRISPLWIIWEDGRRYEIDRVRSVQRAASRKAGGAGIRYVCMVKGNEIKLFYEGDGRWFVERRIRAGAE